ncbi:unnamed protein product, partial [Laminaria digitata]
MFFFLSACSRGSGQETCSSDEDCDAMLMCSSAGECVARPPITTREARIEDFSSDRVDVEAGESITLSWKSRNALSGEIAGDDFSYTIPEADLDSGETSVTLADEGATFTLTMRGEDDVEKEAEVSIKVTIPEPEPVPARVISFAATPETILPGESATLRWDMRDATSATLRGGALDLELSGDDLERGSVEVTPDAATSYTLTASNEDGSASETARVSVTGVPPMIRALTASPQSVVQGETTTIAWDVVGASTLLLRDSAGAEIGIADKNKEVDSVEVTVTQNTSYTLTATNSEGVATLSVMVLTRPPISIDSFVASPQLFEEGERVVLSWSISGPVASIIIEDQGGVALDTSAASPAGGVVFVDPTEAATYTLTATGRDGQMEQAIVSIAPVPDTPRIVEFAVDRDEVAANDTVTLSWITVNGVDISIVDDQNNPVDVLGKNPEVDTVDVTITRDTTFTFTVSNPAGAVDRDVSVRVGVPVMATLTANTTMVDQGDPVELSWTTANASAALTITSSDGVSIDLRNKSIPADSVIVYPTNATTTYTLSVPGFGGPATASVVVNVALMTQVSDFFVSPNPVALGDTVTLSWVTASAQSITLTAQDSQGTRTLMTGNMVASGSLQDGPSEDTTYTLTAFGANGAMDSVQEVVAVFPPPSIDLFEANPPASTGGQPVTLSFQTSNATSIELRDSLTGSLIPFDDLGNGAGEVIVTPQETTSYQLFADGVQMSSVNSFVVVDVAAAPLVITELMLDPNGMNAQSQWVEIHNTGDHFVDLGRYFLGAGTADYTDTSAQLQGIIPPRGCVMVGGPTSNGSNAQPTYDQTLDFMPDLPSSGDAGVALFYLDPAGPLDTPIDSIVFGANSAGLLDESGQPDGEVSPAISAGDSLERTSANHDVLRVQSAPTPGNCLAIESLDVTRAPNEASGALTFFGVGFDPVLFSVSLGAQSGLSCSTITPGEYACDVPASAEVGLVDFDFTQTDEYDQNANGDTIT